MPFRVAVPLAPPLPAADVEEAVTRALRGWPIVHLRLVGKVAERGSVGTQRGRWLRQQILRAAGALCECRGEVCDHPRCPLTQVLGPHEKVEKMAGHPWAPWALLAGEGHEAKVEAGTPVRCGVVLAGEAATSRADQLVQAMRDYDPPAGTPAILWEHGQAMVQEGGELRWRNLEGGPVPWLALDELEEPRTRSGRLTLACPQPAIFSRPREPGVAHADLPLFIDRLSRTLATWMEHTGHQGPPLPTPSLLGWAAQATLQSDHGVAGRLPAGLIDRHALPGVDVATWSGAATWTGDFSALGALLRAGAHVGLGPGRHHGLGELSLR
jgi:hypothetical protein